MKGIVLAGGLGTRLHPLTRVTNKHLLPVYDRPMIFYPIEKLIDAGIHDILVVTGGHHAGDFLRLLGNGREFGLKHLNYTYQEGEGGIAEALGLAEHFADGQPVMVILGDNLFQDSLAEAVRRYRQRSTGSCIFLKEVEDPERFGVPRFEDGRITRIIEKPTSPPSSFAVTGAYIYDAHVFDIIRTLEPSARNELEITDVNNIYIDRGELDYEVLDGWWADAGTFQSLYRAATLVNDLRHGAEQDGAEPPAGMSARASTPGRAGLEE